MKELSIKQKATHYDEVLNRAKKELNTCGSQDCDAARQIFRLFPELKESEEGAWFVHKEGMQVGYNESFNSLRNQAAIAAMQGVMNFFGSIDYNRETIAKLAVEQADALIKQLKEK